MLEKLVKITKIFSLVAIPIIVAVLGYRYQAIFESEKLSIEYVKLSLEIVKDKNEVDPYLHDWAVETLNYYSKVKMSQKLSNSLKQGASSVESSPIESGWFAVIGSLTTVPEAQGFITKIKSTQPQEFEKYAFRIYKTNLSQLYAVTIGGEVSKTEAIRRVRSARDSGWVPDAFAQRNLGWDKVK